MHLGPQKKQIWAHQTPGQGRFWFGVFSGEGWYVLLHQVHTEKNFPQKTSTKKILKAINWGDDELTSP